MPTVSILMCTYNAWQYILPTLKSILNQTFTDFELLILDNWSDDNTVNNIRSFDDKRIVLFEFKKNLWPYAWLNFLLKKAKWIYIAIQDHDDIWHTKKLEKQVKFLEKNSKYIGCWTKTIMYFELSQKYFEYFLWNENFYTIHPSIMFRYDRKFYYNKTETEYMCDALSLKYNLCNWKKIIANINESLTVHIIKKWSINYSYKWYKFNLINIKQIYKIHSFLYATMILLWEIKRKMLYPILQYIWLWRYIDLIELIPFKFLWKKIQKINWTEWWFNLLKKN